MQPAGNATISAPPQKSSDIVFTCNHCSTSLVVDAAAAGLAVHCGNCHTPIRVPAAPIRVPTAPIRVPAPPVATAPANAVRIAEIQHQLKENESQRTEITGYINQLGIQLHRWQLRLQSLNERQQKLEAELAAARK